MLYFIDGEPTFFTSKYLVLKSDNLAFKIFVNQQTLNQLQKENSKQKIRIFVYLNVKEDALELYGFIKKEELEFFELLNSVAGVGPKSALALIGQNEVENLKAAILSNKIEVLTKTSGIGRKTAERIILELKSKVTAQEDIIEGLDSDIELEDALLDLGYQRATIKKILKQIPDKKAPLNERLKIALKLLSDKKNND
ncbi:MAG TPA: Holliday junction branch migration protein RuvA [Candidatus Paceibacterota bacterium]|nr:Holliday junction branch migration protein RuvA [Candidatus Paceibacterota bacterium]